LKFKRGLNWVKIQIPKDKLPKNKFQIPKSKIQKLPNSKIQIPNSKIQISNFKFQSWVEGWVLYLKGTNKKPLLIRRSG